LLYLKNYYFTKKLTIDTLRFLSQFNTGQGNYTKDRESLFANLTLEEIITDIKKTRNTPLS